MLKAAVLALFIVAPGICQEVVLTDELPLGCHQLSRGAVIFRGLATQDYDRDANNRVKFQVLERFYGLGTDQNEFEILPDGELVQPKQGQTWLVFGIPDTDKPGSYLWLIDKQEERLTPEYLESLRSLALGMTSTQIFGRASMGGKRLAGAAVQIAGEDGKTSQIETDLYGEFTLSGIAPGKYAIRATHPKFFLTEPQELVVLSGGCGVADLEFKFDATISGTVRDSVGLPVPNVRVNLRPSDEALLSDADFYGTTETDEEGNYRFRHVSPGRYHVGQNVSANTETVRISEDSRKVVVDISVPAGREFRR